MTTVWAMSHGMNWDWFAQIQLNQDSTATVLCEGRLHKCDPRQGAEVIGRYHEAAGQNRYRIYEEEGSSPRMAKGVHLNGTLYYLREPIFRFGFPNLVKLED